MPSRLRHRLRRIGLFLGTLVLGQQAVHAQAAPTPRQLIDRLGVETRQLLERPRPGWTAEDAERAVANQISTLVRKSPGDESLTDIDEQGRTPLIQAVSGGYLLVVKALLADPIVKALVNVPDGAGETAWMVANFAPALTLAACQPGTLTLERYPLLQPYLLRMSALLKAKDPPLPAIVRALEAVGAKADPDRARRAWLARCPNTAPELREALALGPVLSTLVDDAVNRHTGFSKALREGSASVPQTPPTGMKFVHARDGARTNTNQLKCSRRTPPSLRGALNWSGQLLFKAEVATRAGIVEAVDVTLLSPGEANPHVVNYFRSAIVQALATHQCEGDHVFVQEFNFKVE